MSDLVHVKGLSELQKFLDQLPAKVERNVLRGALRAAAKEVLLPQARANINSDSGELAKSLRVSVRAKRGTVTASVKSDLFYARFVEYGTRQHWVSVKPEARPSRITRRGRRAFSIGTLNEMAARGSLVIGSAFVGASVAHPGARPHPFLLPALDTQAHAVLLRVGDYIKTRLASKHGLEEAAGVELGVDEEIAA